MRLLQITLILLIAALAVPKIVAAAEKGRTIPCEEALRTDPTVIEIRSYLGGGADALVYRVSVDGTPLVLKLFHQAKSDHERQTEIEVHKILSARGFAPKIVGVLSEDDVSQLVSANRSKAGFLRWEILGYFKNFAQISEKKYGLLMEEVRGQSVKYPSEGIHRKITLSPAQLDKAYKQIEEIDALLRKNRISPDDMDFVVTAEGDVRLIDLSRYDFVLDSRGVIQEFRKSARKRLQAAIHFGFISVK